MKHDDFCSVKNGQPCDCLSGHPAAIDAELQVMAEIIDILDPFDVSARQRILAYVRDRNVMGNVGAQQFRAFGALAAQKAYAKD